MSMIGNLLRVSNTELQEYLKDSSLLENRVYSEGADPTIVDIDKSWEGILFLLTGQSLAEADHPLAAVLFSGQIIDENQDLGYGPAHYVTPAQVAELNAQISKISFADLEQKFDPAKMMESGIYPDIWEERDVAIDYLAENYNLIRDIYAKAAANGEAIITFVN